MLTGFDNIKGIKLRKINQGHSSNPRDVVFSVPLPPEEVAALELYRRPLVPLDPETPLKNLQMVPFHINGPGVIGYSFCWSERLFYLHAHHEEDNLAMYKDFDTLTEDPFWIHLPIAPDEYINSVWFRRAAYTSDLALWITTNKGNQTIVGPTEAHPILQNSNLAELFPGAAFEWVRLIGPLNEGQSVQMYFNLSERGIKVFATLQPNIAITPGPGPPEWLRSAYSTDHGSWFSESAWLINVVEIIPFQKKASGSVKRVQGEKPYFDAWGSHSPIIGLVLVYSNGARVCLGQVRLDCATPPIDMRHVTTFYMAFRQARRNPYLSEIRLSAPTTPDDMATAWRWLKIDLSQRTVLEWHLYKGFHSGCHVRYGDQTTFEDE
ncbi:hypothetical protein B0T21DRAFT_97530 [Apiosordaria backusii]|uniref:Uncharacterized protein n=1 Tax=Apiosordaria backusii TaxID=314023 RepID=A0AA40K430_9PEZI|nr:hypothetical protein B0T21DRAFT_97530 [Apiosordaria backusii]